MSKVVLTLGCLSCALLTISPHAQGANAADFIDWDYDLGTTGTATRKGYLHVPANYDPSRAYPLVYFMHGVGGNGIDSSINNLVAWLNGTAIRDSFDRKGTAELKLKQGWNVLVFKSNHLEWQWQFDITAKPASPEVMDDLRFSVVPRDVAIRQ